jgi:hypothetical protein
MNQYRLLSRPRSKALYPGPLALALGLLLVPADQSAAQPPVGDSAPQAAEFITRFRREWMAEKGSMITAGRRA